MNAYSLMSVRPKMKKADPASRTSCRYENPSPTSAPGSRILICQNIIMAQSVDQLQNLGPGLSSPVLDATKLEGGWDFTLTYSPMALARMLGPGRGGDAAPLGADLLTAPDPGGGYSIFEAVEKELGLKLEMQKRPMSVIVIDHIEEKPTDN